MWKQKRIIPSSPNSWGWIRHTLAASVSLEYKTEDYLLSVVCKAAALVCDVSTLYGCVQSRCAQFALTSNLLAVGEVARPYSHFDLMSRAKLSRRHTPLRWINPHKESVGIVSLLVGTAGLDNSPMHRHTMPVSLVIAHGGRQMCVAVAPIF